jgi:cold shock protein
MSERESGTVCFFDDTKGFGFVQPDGASPSERNKHLFIAGAALQRNGLMSVTAGDRITYRREEPRLRLNAFCFLAISAAALATQRSQISITPPKLTKMRFAVFGLWQNEQQGGRGLAVSVRKRPKGALPPLIICCSAGPSGAGPGSFAQRLHVERKDASLVRPDGRTR